MESATATEVASTEEVNPDVLDAAETLLDASEENDSDEDGPDLDSPAATPAPSPFALTDDREFTSQPPAKPAPSLVPSPIPLPSASPTPPLPGTPGSLYRHCSCLGVLPGRACPHCFNSHWTKICPKCEGEGRIELAARAGGTRSAPCGNCMGKGTLPASLAEIKKAIETVVAEGEGQTEIVVTAAPEYRRAVRLPGIGVTSFSSNKPRWQKSGVRAADNEKRKKQHWVSKKQGKGKSNGAAASGTVTA